jgi:hypothetical protein
MSLTRRFLLAPSLARLIEKECGAYRLTEGFFPERADRSTYVRVGDGANYLMLLLSSNIQPAVSSTRKLLCRLVI